MTKSQSSMTFFFQEYCKKHNLTHEEIQERFAILQYSVEAERDKVQDHQTLEVIFQKLRQAAQNKRAQTHSTNQDACQSHQATKKEHSLVVSVESATELAVLEYFQAFFQSDRSPCEILKLSNRLFILGQAYNKSGK